MSTELIRQIRVLLKEQANNERHLQDVLSLVDSFVLECPSSPDHEALLTKLQDELHRIQDDIVDNTRQSEVFLDILHRLTPLLCATSIINNWWDLCLRPALREPKLSTNAVTHAKALVIAALTHTDVQSSDRSREFRRQLMDLYLLDAFDESSGEDILEWAEMDQKERDKRTCWKINLEDLLVRFGSERPADLLDEVNDHFTPTPTCRLRLLTLLLAYTSHSAFPSDAASTLAAHPLMNNLLLSLQLDNSSAVCTVALTVFIKLLPVFAVRACEELKTILPRLLAVLARVICWKGGQPLALPGTPDEAGVEETLEAKLRVRPQINWKRLDYGFQTAMRSAPPPHQYLTFLYYLFPCNTIRFLRYPVRYLEVHKVESPYTVDWEDALDDAHLKSRSEPLLRGLTVHPQIIWGDADTELSEEGHWAEYDVSRIVGECTMLDVRNGGLAMRQRSSELRPKDARPVAHIATAYDEQEDTVTPRMYAADLPAVSAPAISLEDMVSTSLTLRSGRDVEVTELNEKSARAIFGPLRRVQSTPSPTLLPVHHNDDVPSHVAQAIAGLQKDVLLLRNELNLELWLNRENIKHIGRLHEERVLSRNAEVERQGLHNKLREYKATALRLQESLKSHQEQAAVAKQRSNEWTTGLNDKLKDLRNQKRKWDNETASLRSENVDLKAKFEAQGKLLASATNRVFELETKIKETAHKVERLRDYEATIEQLTNTQRLWDADVQKYNNLREEMKILHSQYKKMQLQLESYEKTQAAMDETARDSREQVRTLETRLAVSEKERQKATARSPLADAIRASADEKAALMKANSKLREQVHSYRQEIDQIKAGMEMLRADAMRNRNATPATAG